MPSTLLEKYQKPSEAYSMKRKKSKKKFEFMCRPHRGIFTEVLIYTQESNCYQMGLIFPIKEVPKVKYFSNGSPYTTINASIIQKERSLPLQEAQTQKVPL